MVVIWAKGSVPTYGTVVRKKGRGSATMTVPSAELLGGMIDNVVGSVIGTNPV